MAEARILYVATADGLVQLANPGKSDRWRTIARALGGTAVRAVAASPHDALLVYAASTAGLHRSTNGGATWEVVQSDPITALAFDGSGTIYAGTERGVVLSSADGDTWAEDDASPGAIVRLTASNDLVLSVAKDGTVCQRTPAGWRPREVQVPNVRGIAVSPAEQHSLFVVNRTSLITPLCGRRLDLAPSGAITVLGGQDEVLLVGTESGLLRSADEGATLQPVDGPTNVTVLVTLPRFIDQVFAGTAHGDLWFSADRGRSWTALLNGLPPINDLAFARAL